MAIFGRNKPPDEGIELDRVRGMLLGGALGDTLGGPVEFLSIRLIRNKYGSDGIVEPVPAPDGLLEITDDTQMTLFTLEGLVLGHREGAGNVTRAVHGAYLRWLITQGDTAPAARTEDGWLIGHERLHRTRAPGSTCLTALRATATTDAELGSTTHLLNNSKGCGTVMRSAPVGLWPGDANAVFTLGVDTAALTHSHPSGYLAAGTLAVLIRRLLRGGPFTDAIAEARAILRTWPGHDEVEAGLDAAIRLARGKRPPTPEEIEYHLGGGWTAEEALAIAVCAALCGTDLADGLRLATNHSGDSDSCAAVAGNILGAHLGYDALPPDWLRRLELVDVMERLAEEAYAELATYVASRRTDGTVAGKASRSRP